MWKEAVEEAGDSSRGRGKERVGTRPGRTRIEGPSSSIPRHRLRSRGNVMCNMGITHPSTINTHRKKKKKKKSLKPATISSTTAFRLVARGPSSHSLPGSVSYPVGSSSSPLKFNSNTLTNHTIMPSLRVPQSLRDKLIYSCHPSSRRRTRFRCHRHQVYTYHSFLTSFSTSPTTAGRSA